MSLQATYPRRFGALSDPGKLDRQVQLFSEQRTQLSTGEVVSSWLSFATVWASKHPLSSARLIAAEGKHALNLVRFRIRHRTDVVELMRLMYGNDTYEIIGMDELGRQHLLDLECRAIDQTVGARL